MGGIELVMCIDSSIFGERNSRILNFVLLIAAGVFLLCVIFSVVVSRIITTRINVLEKKMRNFVPGSAIEKVRCRRGRLRNQIVLYYLLVCFVPIVVMSVSYYSILVDIIEEEVINSFNQSAGHISDNIIMSTDGYAVDGRYIAGNSYIQQLLRENREPESRRLWPVIKVAAGERGCENLTLYRADGSVLYSLKPICTEKLETAPEKIQWLIPHYDLFGEKVASILIPINSSDYRLDKYMERIGYLKIDFREDILSDALLVADSNDAQVYITDRSGYIIAAEQQTEIGKKADEIKKGARVISEQPVSENWQMCAVMQTGRLLGNRKMILLYCFMVLLMALILITLIGSQIASIIVTPIQMLNEYLKSPLPRKIGEKPELKTGDEIEQLCNSFNDMSAEIERLINIERQHVYYDIYYHMVKPVIKYSKKDETFIRKYVYSDEAGVAAITGRTVEEQHKIACACENNLYIFTNGNNEIIGSVVLREKDDTLDVVELFIKKELRRSENGSKFLDEIEKMAADEGFARITIPEGDNWHTHTFCYRRGYTKSAVQGVMEKIL